MRKYSYKRKKVKLARGPDGRVFPKATPVPNMLNPIQEGEESTASHSPALHSQSPKHSTPSKETPIGWPVINSPLPLVFETKKEVSERRSKMAAKGDAVPTGRRLITLSSWERSLKLAMEHGKKCRSDGVPQITKEKRLGLQSLMQIECVGCGWLCSINTDFDPEKTLPVNEALTWGTYGGASHFEASQHIFTALEVPFPTFKSFQRYEDKLCDDWSDALVKDLTQNGLNEKRKAEANNQFVVVGGSKLPFTTVAVDGGWSTRSYGHSYKSKGGVGVIIGRLTGKVLYVGIRNKFCMFCKRHENDPNISAHRCYKNYDPSRSAASMEPDILLEGFNSSIEDHGLVYKRLIGDGDSSVFNTLVEHVKYPGTTIEKIECVNHAVKRFNKSLIEVSKNNKAYSLSERRALAEQLPRFGKSLRSAINHAHGQEKLDVDKLRKDIKNIPYHTFGSHDACQTYFCTDDRKGEVNRVPQMEDTAIWEEILEIGNRTANIADKLIHNITSNQAESFMNRAAKFNMGKRMFVMGRSGWKIRMMAAALSFNHGPNFYSHAKKLVSGISPALHWKLMQQRQDKRSALAKLVIKPRKLYNELGKSCPRPSKRRTITRKPPTGNVSGDRDYGLHAQYPDISEQEMSRKIDELIKSRQIVDKQESIESATIGQTGNARWKRERRGRITASVCGHIFRLRDWSSNKSVLNKFFSKKSLDDLDAIEHGGTYEDQAKRAYQTQTGNTVQECGLFVDLEDGIFAASPDGLVGEDGIVEIKCPYSLIGYPPTEMPNIMKSSYLVPDPNNRSKLTLKRTSLYYRQIAMQLNVTGRLWCDFAVYTFANSGKGLVSFPLFVERIYRTETTSLWIEMKKKLERFYREDYAPELLDSRSTRNMIYRTPAYRMEAQVAQQAAQEAKKNPSTTKRKRQETLKMCPNKRKKRDTCQKVKGQPAVTSISYVQPVSSSCQLMDSTSTP